MLGCAVDPRICLHLMCSLLRAAYHFYVIYIILAPKILGKSNINSNPAFWSVARKSWIRCCDWLFFIKTASCVLLFMSMKLNSLISFKFYFSLTITYYYICNSGQKLYQYKGMGVTYSERRLPGSLSFQNSVNSRSIFLMVLECPLSTATLMYWKAHM